MKRITALLLAVLCMLSVCACNNGSKAAGGVEIERSIAGFCLFRLRQR